MEEHERRRSNDPMLQSVLDSLKAIGEAMQQGFRDAHARIDDIYTKVGKIDGLDAKVNSFILLMEKMNDHAAGDIEELKKHNADKEARLRSIETQLADGSFGKLKEDVAGLKATGISQATRGAFWAKAGDVFLRNWLGPLLVLLAAYILWGRQPVPVPAVTITPPAAILPAEPRQEGSTHGKANARTS